MNRVLLLHWLLLTLLIFQPATAATEHPNIVVIMADDVSSKIGAFGDSIAQTPNLDKLAAGGIRYTNFFTVAGVCAPSRAAHITGMYPISFGAQHMRTEDKHYRAVPPPHVKAYPELLRRAGYATANVAKRDYQFGEPFSIWDVDVNGFMDEPDLAVWRKLPSGKPFFAMINLLSTHESRLAPRKTQETIEGPHAGFLKAMGGWVSQNVQEVTQSKDVTVPPYLPDTPKVRDSVTQMYDLIHYMDAQVGSIISNLEEDSLLENTIILWTTDNGDGFPRAKRAVLDSGIKLPMILRFPDGVSPNTVDSRLVSMVDIAPAVLTMAGVEVPDYMQGRNFLSNQRDYIFAARDRMDQVEDKVRAVRNKRYKLIRNYLADKPYFRPLPFRDWFPAMQELNERHQAGLLTPLQESYFSAPRAEIELYDTLNDPHEINNIAGQPDVREIQSELESALDNWMDVVDDGKYESEDMLINAMWPGGNQPQTSAPVIKLEEVSGNKKKVILSSQTEGASITYSTDPEQKHWHLYTGHLVIDDESHLSAKAIRYGFAESTISTQVKN